MTVDASSWHPNPDDHCKHCGTPVGPMFRRIYGDDDDVVHRCTQCDSWTRISKGSAAGRTPDYQERSRRKSPNQVVATDGGGSA